MTHLLNTLTEIWGWIRIFISPVLISFIVAALVVLSFNNNIAWGAAILIQVIGIVLGTTWANKIYSKSKGTMWYLSQTNSWPEKSDDE